MATRIVLDANVWVRYARHKDIAPLTNRIAVYDFIPVVNNYLLSEVFDALTDNKWMSAKIALKTIDLIRSTSYSTAENVVYKLSPDHKDNYLFDLAIQHNCPFIISDDKLLLSFVVKPIKVKSSSWFHKYFPA